MGEVLLAHDTLLKRRVALKRVRADGVEGAAPRSAVLREARRASQVNDPRIAAIYDVLDLESGVLIVMEYVEGTTLRERMSGPLPVAEFWDIAIPCVEAVAAAHDHGIIHRDIKPENLIVTPDGRIKVLDFGIARRAEMDQGTPTAVTTTMTIEGRAPFIAGTPQYMAPEAHYGGRLDARADIFSLGTLFYELLTGRNPFSGLSYTVVLGRVMNTVPEPASNVNHSVGPGLSAVIARMMAKDPAERYPTCGDVKRHLAAVRRPGLAGAEVPATGTRARRAIRWPAVAAGLLALAAFVTAWGLWQGSKTALPAERYLAVLPPRTVGTDDDFASLALGAIDRLAARIEKHQDRAGFQLASFQETLDEKVATPADAHQVQGANLALLSTLEQKSDLFRARLELWDAARGRRIASRIVETPSAQPFAFLDRVYLETVRMLRLPPRPGDAASAIGVRGAGTLRFLLQGIGRMRASTSEAQARRALDDLELAIRTDPEGGVTRAWRSAAEWQCFTLGGDRAWLDRAEASAREAVARDSARAEAHRFLARALAGKGDRPGALAAFRRSVELDPTDDATVLGLAGACADLGQAALEGNTYQTAVSARPHCWQPREWLAAWYLRQGRLDESARAYREMIRLAPDLYRGYASLGGVLVFTGAYPQAIDTLKRSIALRPNRAAFDHLGTAYFNTGRLADAVATYNQSFQSGFADYASWVNLGDAFYWLRGPRDQARQAYDQAVRLGREESARREPQGGSPDVMIPARLATLFPKIGQPDSARAYLARALRAGDTSADVQWCAALTWWQLDDRKRALTCLERAVRGGYPVAWLRDSPVFEEWRPEGAFRALLAGASAHAPGPAAPRR
jgi:tetratricopeptide (TPR) repeat protein/tRNA A-37 threonylcarbamoyl transferase component Bud32